MSRPWRPHGLIGRPELEYAYQEARVSRDKNGRFIDPKEHKTIRLFERLFNRAVFTEDRFFVNSQQPPTEDSSLSCDIVVSAVNGAYEDEIFCFCEGKRAKKTRGFEIRDVENQVHNYCKVHLDEHPDKPRVYACTLVGTYIRCWVVDQNQRVLEGIWDPESRGSASSYLDVGVEEHRSELGKAFGQLKALPITAVGLGQSYENLGSSSQWGFESQRPVPSQFILPSSASTGQASTAQAHNGEAILNPAETIHVQPSIYERSSDINSTVYRFQVGSEGGKRQYMQKHGRDWMAGKMEYQGILQPCVFVQSMTTQETYWTWSLGG